jgi:RHS repeat-associated protein
LYWLDGTNQGTMTTAVPAFNESGTIIRRAFTPYGTPVTGTGTWPANRTLLNDPEDPATGLITIGARQLNPATGLFISVDPILDTSNPQTMTGYTYAADDPISSEDPTGLHACSTGDGSECEYAPPPSGGSTNPSVYNGSNGSSYGTTTPTNTTGGGGAFCGRFGCPDHTVIPALSSSQLGIWTWLSQRAAPLIAGFGATAECTFATGGLGAAPCAALGDAVAVHVARSGGSVGICGSAFGGIGLETTESACLIVADNNVTKHLQMGLSLTAGGGTGIPTESIGVATMVSNATSISEQRGPFVQLGGSGELGFLSAGGDVALGHGPRDGNIVDFSAGPGVSADLPFPPAGFEIHGFLTGTTTFTFFDWRY